MEQRLAMSGRKRDSVSHRNEETRAVDMLTGSPPTPGTTRDSSLEQESKRARTTCQVSPLTDRASNNGSAGCTWNSNNSDQVPHEMSREASLRTLQLIRMQSQHRMIPHASTTNHDAVATYNHRDPYERQRLLAGLVEAAAVVASVPTLPEPTQRYSHPNQGFSHGFQGFQQPTFPPFQPQDDLSFQVSQYLQMQADKHRYPGQEEQFSNNGFLQSRDYRLPNVRLSPRMPPPSQGPLYSNLPDLRFEQRDDPMLMDMSSRLGAPSMMIMNASVSMAPEGEVPLCLPVNLARSVDVLKVSSHQVLLRQQIEAFQATEEDISTHTRGRNKPIVLGQVGIRCRHCAHVPVLHRQKGSTYFPATTLGLYQAAQNMSTTHIQCGLCTHMPMHIKAQFAHIMALKSTNSGAGRPYWAESAKQLGLVDTEGGIFFVHNMPPNAVLLDTSKVKVDKTK